MLFLSAFIEWDTEGLKLGRWIFESDNGFRACGVKIILEGSAMWICGSTFIFDGLFYCTFKRGFFHF